MDKQNLKEEFEMAKSIEISAAELYEQIASAPDIEDQTIKTTFKNLAKDEHRHAEIVQEIINIINTCL
ncbi:MAG: ferritin family protein [Planctomycetota bacterium]|jgi:rubrerythrin